MRIVSLVPSITELLCDLGLREQIVGCTKFCVRPKDIYKSATIVGGTKDCDLNLIRSLVPTHIIANQEENQKEHVISLMQDFPLLITFPKSAEEASSMIRQIGSFFGISSKANLLADKLDDLIKELKQYSTHHSFASRSFLYLIWANPWMAAGDDTYISRLLELAGFKNSLKASQRYPIITSQDLSKIDCQMLLFSSEPWPFRIRDIKRFLKLIEKKPEVYKIDGRIMSWYGSSSLLAIEQMIKWLKNSPDQILVQKLNIEDLKS